jgi:hypothetical protein
MDFTLGYETCLNEINTTLNGAVAHMDEQKSAQGTLDAINMIIARVHTLKQELNAYKDVFKYQGGM